MIGQRSSERSTRATRSLVAFMDDQMIDHATTDLDDLSMASDLVNAASAGALDMVVVSDPELGYPVGLTEHCAIQCVDPAESGKLVPHRKRHRFAKRVLVSIGRLVELRAQSEGEPAADRNAGVRGREPSDGDVGA
jgi:hypothetical protein